MKKINILPSVTHKETPISGHVTYVSDNSKPDHPPGQTPGEFFERVNLPPPGHKESVKPRSLEQINRAKTPPPGQLFFKMQQKNLHKTWDRNYEKQ